MEYINGSEAISIIRGLEAANKIKKVNICTISAMDEYNNKIESDYNLIKPISIEGLETMLNKLSLI